jgi:vitamin B12/bleomycin/antimicrobial peptide transport system ATP-binding/permease protein
MRASPLSSITAKRESLKRRYLLRRFWRSGLAYWSSGSRAVPLTAALILVIVFSVGVQYLLNVWNRSFFNALERHDTSALLLNGLLFPVLAGATIALWGLHVRWRTAIQRGWRTWLDNDVTNRWLRSGRYYQLNLISGDHKNPEFRIAEDLRIATEAPIDFAAGVLQAALSAITFIIVLWSLGGALTIPLGQTTLIIPGFLVIGAVIYAAIASGTMVAVGGRYITAAENKNQAEAEYRYVLTRLRENGESIALLGGEEEERAQHDHTLRHVIRRSRDVAVQYMRTTMISQGSAQIAPIFPILLCAPKYVSGEMSLGEMMQAASAFVSVQSAFGWLVDNYPRFADWTASARRTASLMVSLDALESGEEENVAASSVPALMTRRCGSITFPSRSTTAPPSSTRRRLRSYPARKSWWSVNPAPEKARWCARSQACGRGALARSNIIPPQSCRCCRNGPTCRLARFAVL